MSEGRNNNNNNEKKLVENDVFDNSSFLLYVPGIPARVETIPSGEINRMQ